MWIVMKYYTALVDEPGKERRRYEPRFFFDSSDSTAAEALSQKLNRVMTTWYTLVNLPEERKGDDHTQQLARAEAVVKRFDPDATPDARYRVEESFPYTGPTEDLTPVIVAMMGAFAQLPNPPADPFEALFRLIGA